MQDRRQTLVSPAPPVAGDPLWDLEALSRARRLGDWMFDQFADAARGSVVEVGAGIGTFSERLLEAAIERLVLLEPEERCARVLGDRFADDPRVTIAADEVPGSAALARAADAHDLVLCQNVLEHVEADLEAVAEMTAVLRPGGTLGLLVPAHPRLFGSLDVAYGHKRRYTMPAVRSLLETAGLRVASLRAFNLLGIVGWWASGRLARTRITPASLRVYEALVRGWRPIEDRLLPPWGLSIVARGIRQD